MSRDTLVVGAAGGVGLATVKRLVRYGDTVVATVYNDSEGALVRSEVPGVSAILVLDLSRADDVHSKLTRYLSESSGIDALIVCAAILAPGALEIAPLQQLRQALEVNAVSSLAIFQASLPALRSRNGRLVYTGSIGGKVAVPVLGCYSMSKYALEAFADVARRELHGSGVSLSLIEPGAIRTRMSDDLPGLLRSARAGFTPAQERSYGAAYERLATGQEAERARALQPDDVAAVVMECLNAERPLPRYLVGQQAEELARLNRTLSDAELDALLLG
jgi:NAD(P)-dependent dehydrogenase (short-subunit alcohol dehydrogenase family)